MEQKKYEQYLTAKRNNVIELELNARYWKAQYEIKQYTLQDAELQEKYLELQRKFVEAEEKLNQIDVTEPTS